MGHTLSAERGFAFHPWPSIQGTAIFMGHLHEKWFGCRILGPCLMPLASSLDCIRKVSRLGFGPGPFCSSIDFSSAHFGVVPNFVIKKHLTLCHFGTTG